MGSTSTGGPAKPAWNPAIDRREAPRQNVVDSHLVTVDLAFQSGALLLDLSEAGIGVQALSSAPAGDTTSLHFELPETGGRVDALGRIAWTDSSGRLGIRFEEVSELSRTHLAQWLSRARRPLAPLGGNLAMPAWPPAHMRDEIAALRRDLVTQRLEGDEALALVVERTRSVTRATGAAVALEDKNAVVCRASSGNAPGIGAHLDPNSGLSGECFRNGEIVRCEDTETDPRADRLVCRKLDLRSIVIVPIRIQGRPAGVLEAFSSRAHAFQSGDVLLLRRVADLVAGIAVRQLDSIQTAPAGPHAVMATTILEPLEPESVATAAAPLMMDEILELGVEAFDFPPAGEFPEEETATAEEEMPNAAIQAAPEAATPGTASLAPREEAEGKEEEEWQTAEGTQAAAAPASELKSEAEPRPAAPMATIPEVSASAGESPKAIPSPDAMRAPEEKKSRLADTAERRYAPAYNPPVVASAGAAAAAAKAPVKPKPIAAEQEINSAKRIEPILAEMAADGPAQKRMRIAGAAILVVVLTIGGWQVWRLLTPASGTPMDIQIAQPVPAPPPAAIGPASAASAPTATAAATPAPQQAARQKPAPAKPASFGRLVPVSPTPAPPKIPDGQPALAEEVTTRRIADGASAPANGAAAGNNPASPITVPPPATAEIPPPIGFVSRPVKSTVIATVLSAPVAAPTLSTPPVSRITGGKLLRRVSPVYPSSARGVFGEVILKVMIGKDGKVKSVKVVKGYALLGQAAALAIKRWRYEPFMLNGVPIEMENTVRVEFRPAQR